MRKVCSFIHLSTLIVGGAAFSSVPTAKIAPPSLATRTSELSVLHNHNDHNNESRICNNHDNVPVDAAARMFTSAAVSFAILTSPLHNAATQSVAHADEWGKETEAPTLFTGETVMICKKRGPLGACLETSVRTVQNDNDKALKYFKDPSAEVKKRQERMLQSAAEDSEGNALIQKLRKQSEDNKEKNDLAVLQKTLMNDQGASFGPFNGQVVILNTDGRTFTLLQNPQAMRLKKAGYIEDRKFVIQPSQEAIDEALEGRNEIGDAIRGFFGGGTGAGDEEVQVEVKSEEAQVEVKSEVEVVNSVALEESAVVEGANSESAGEATSDSS
mmetsp:Transcript_13699/g.29734  ORF Transcript_13699/g.29734 Transcript_13699/m.29734 type:complete len:329 (-) Transcript_13699:250-1236(-)|eukprot:CAMPEP_0172555016 /NCGR_PEP_ID=MMETSP1067-20121228/57590_1 /TAXON_ID=265564 ORGANISM="Thalassiosira punctigera, Strain Tpunct2005C2" /NCGR_SAMPLE_ID=MMETSP1067 /ASSEMBLY_ACC=CAM_ASM_000444 /LENGTH=328 /DNA_ID=CAMNT_0013343513 /DNA_START=77 /DNA_END=1063 /DNA_ORIENTATION=-